ncbi:MAG: PhzF family phenazine biosynthesis protein, partial [Acidobacteriaceae bacterium]|nr:PhzF family phenazine biosynthesis protein [Acidobacteriaceae bacterium]
NPAAVCPLEAWLPDDLMQSIAAENNLAETAFFVKNDGRYHLRWFTPVCEVDLCGHATLASAHVLFEELGYDADVIRFDTKSGELAVRREGGRLAMNFPSRPPQAVEPDPILLPALGGKPAAVLAARDYLVVFDSEDELKALRPDMPAISKLDRFAVIVTAPGRDCDFASRFFAPAQGIPEDPATGSSHCTLAPYWASRLGKTKLHARQVSPRGGELFCELEGDRVKISGHAALFLKGQISF